MSKKSNWIGISPNYKMSGQNPQGKYKVENGVYTINCSVKMNPVIDWKKLIVYLLKLRMDRQSDFAKRFGVGQQSVSHWVTGVYQPGLKTQLEILQYCKTLNVNIGDYNE